MTEDRRTAGVTLFKTNVLALYLGDLEDYLLKLYTESDTRMLKKSVFTGFKD